MIVNQGALPMAPNLLILGGSTEASAFAAAVAARGLRATLSYAGVVANPRLQPVAVRIGGFGGAAGLARYLKSEGVTHLIDATHPFAAGMSANAVAAAAETGTPLLTLTRPPWKPVAEDDWRVVPDIAAAVAALDRPARRVMLAIGRQNADAFAAAPQHHYLLRVVEPLETPPPLPDCEVVVARGPFDTLGDTKLMASRKIEILVAKNSGGTAAAAKLVAARALRLPVIMIDRPATPERDEVGSVDAAFEWLARHGADLGV